MITRHSISLVCAATLFLVCSLIPPSLSGRTAAPPNIIFILADDLGYGELGCYGQKTIQTPHLDRMAAEGMRFVQFYAGSTVCAPSRSVLMTGLHTGHTRVRGNAGARSGAQTLRQGDVTFAHVVQQAGYRTGLVGKWGLGVSGEEGDPSRMGFNYFFGYLDQIHAHNHYPDFLYRNRERITLPNVVTHVGSTGGGYATQRVQYADDLLFEEGRAFVARSKDQPFLLELSLITPHANNERSRELGDGQEVPDHGPYAEQDWPAPLKGQAAMITRMDQAVGGVLQQLKDLGLDERTLVIFTSDNGPHKEGGPKFDPEHFDANGPLRGLKRDLTEGGIRVPFMARWPGRIKAGAVSRHVGYFGDMMATFAELAGGKPPPHLDSISLVPTLLGSGTQPQHEYRYWEFYERGISQAVLLEGRWKGLRLMETTAPIQLYDLSKDIGEEADIAAQHPEMVTRIAEIMRTAHVDNDRWKIPGL